MVVVAIVVVVVLRILRGNKGVSTHAHVLAGQLALLHSSVHLQRKDGLVTRRIRLF